MSDLVSMYALIIACTIDRKMIELFLMYQSGQHLMGCLPPPLGMCEGMTAPFALLNDHNREERGRLYFQSVVSYHSASSGSVSGFMTSYSILICFVLLSES